MDLSNISVILQVVIVFGLIVFVHELGHFLFAKWAGVGVERFSFGFGPKLLGKQVGETEYLISAVPLGGYVKMVGEEVGETVDPEMEQKSFAHKPVGKRILIVIAGPLFNFIMAFVVFSIAFLSFGINVPLDVAQVDQVIPDAPAHKAGLERGDKVLSIGGVPVATWKDLAEQIQKSQGKETPIIVQREKSDQPIELKVTPEMREDPTGESKYAIGITPVAQSQSVSLGQSIVLGVQETWAWTKMIGWSLWMLVTGQASAKELGGPILIVQVAHQQAMLGLAYLLRFTAIINVNLAVFNLLPIPLLDGGHLLFFLIELLLGRPLSVRSREMAWRVGFFVILTLIVFVFYNDIARLVG